MTELLYIPSPADEYISLSKTTGNSPRLFRKKILPMNKSFTFPGDPTRKIHVDASMAQSLVDNFKKGICEIVPMPLVDASNHHSESPLNNSGRCVGLDYDDTGVYATLQPTEEYADDFGTKFLGASASLHLNYLNTETGEFSGPTLLHVGITNRPHLTNLGDYTEILKASADNEGEEAVVVLPEEENIPQSEQQEEVESEAVENAEEEIPETEEKEIHMTVDEMIASLKEQGIDVEALQADAAKAADLSAQLDSVTEQLQLSGDSTVQITDVAEAVVELSNRVTEQNDQIASLLESNRNFAVNAAASEVDGLIRTGRLLPKQREVMIKLSMDDRESFEALVPDVAVVSLSENGVTVHDDPNADAEKREEQIAHYKEIAARMGGKARA